MHQKINNANIEVHVHPFLDRNSIVDVVDAMNKRDLDIIALEVLDASIYPTVVHEVSKYYENASHDPAGIRFPNGKYILNGREYNTKEGFHILTVGYTFDDAHPQTEIRKIIDEGLEHNALVILDHSFVDNTKNRTAGHISKDVEQSLEELCKEYSGKIALEWNAYCIPWVRYILRIGLNTIGREILYHDVNKKVEGLSNKLRKQGYELPIIADTDVHARNKRQLLAMGTSRFITNNERECASDILFTMKTNIFNGNYENIKKYVNPFHLLGSFAIPVLFKDYFDKPRA